MMILWRRGLKRNIGKRSDIEAKIKVNSEKLNDKRNKGIELPVQSTVQNPVVCLKKYELAECEFVAHIMKYIGQTVTIFVAGGGVAGAGFTGILITANRCYIGLLTRIGSAPGCSLGNLCYPYLNQNYNHGSFTYLGYMSKKRFFNTVGSVANIPIDKIVSFVHNTV